MNNLVFNNDVEIQEESLNSINILHDFLDENPGVSLKEIISKTGVERKKGLLILNREPLFRQNKKYEWFLSNEYQEQPQGDEPQERTELSNLCKYYLACLGEDIAPNVSAFTSSYSGILKYFEVPSIPEIDSISTEYSNGLNEFKNYIKKDKGRQEVVFGYPVNIQEKKSKKSGKPYYMVEPVFLWPVKDINSFDIDFSDVRFNPTILEKYSHIEKDELLIQLSKLQSDLGIESYQNNVPIDELVPRLHSLHSEWNWIDEMDPYDLNSDALIQDLFEPGIYNKGAFFLQEKSLFTKGLESELESIATKRKREWENTALGFFLGERNINQENGLISPLLEVLPMNTEQREAIKKSLTQPLTVVTGPPGTGKSQVVTNLITNCLWTGQSVLFASKNNKAVNVVEERVNALAQAPTLIRTGSKAYELKLAEFVLSLLSENADETDLLEFKVDKESYINLEKDLIDLEREKDRLIHSKNVFEKADKIVQKIKQSHTEYELSLIDKVANSLDWVQGQSLKMKEQLRKKKDIEDSWIPFFKKYRLDNLSKKNQIILKDLHSIVQWPENVTDHNFDQLEETLSELNFLIEKASIFQKYDILKDSFESCMSLEKITLKKHHLTKQLFGNASSIWHGWVKTRMKRMSHNQRQKLSGFRSLLKMGLKVGGDIWNGLGRNTYYKWKKMQESLVSVLPAWSVSSLSAKGRIPLESGIFDLLIIDEASQCDIASVIPLLYRAKRVVIIGDPMQLSHISALSEKKDLLLFEKFHLENPMWLYSVNSLYDLAAGISNYGNIITLRDHHRSHSDIIRFSNEYFYEGKLRIATNYDKLVCHDDEAGAYWHNVEGKSEKPISGSGAINKKEAEIIIEKIKEILVIKTDLGECCSIEKTNFNGSIGVITPFRAQANYIRELLYSDEDLSDQLITNNILVDTVHKFQGDEKDIIFFSPVVSTGISKGALHFLNSNKELFNVAITRARSQLVVVGNKKECFESGVEYLQYFIKYINRLNNPKAVPKNTTDRNYPTVSNIEQVSEWEKIFYESLKKSGIKAIPQYQIDKYTLDFAVIIGDRKLNIEIDGETYHRNWNGDLCRRDQLRNERLIELGWEIQRFWVYQVRDEMETCIKIIDDWVNRSNDPA